MPYAPQGVKGLDDDDDDDDDDITVEMALLHLKVTSLRIYNMQHATCR
jgi:hypothetical protein